MGRPGDTETRRQGDKETGRQGEGTVRIVLKLLVSLSPCLLVSWPSQAAQLEQKHGPATLRIEVERIENGRPEIRLSDKIAVILTIEGQAGLEVQPLDKVTASADWEISKISRPQKTPLPGSRIRWQQTFVLDPVKAGDLMVTIEPLKYRETTGDVWEETAWKAIPVHVGTEVLQADVQELRDATPPEQLPSLPVWRVPVAWAALPLALAGLGLAVAYCLRRARRQPPLPPDQWALRELERISGLPLNSQTEMEQFHLELSDVVRKFMALRFQLPAPEQTTAEFVIEMQKTAHLQREQQQTLRGLLEHCDLVKFARLMPSAGEAQQVLATARTLVEESTMPDRANPGLANIDKNRQEPLA